MDKSHEQAQLTRKSNAQARRERHERERAELEATINTLRQIRQNPKATPGERRRDHQLSNPGIPWTQCGRHTAERLHAELAAHAGHDQAADRQRVRAAGHTV